VREKININNKRKKVRELNESSYLDIILFSLHTCFLLFSMAEDECQQFLCSLKDIFPVLLKAYNEFMHSNLLKKGKLRVGLFHSLALLK